MLDANLNSMTVMGINAETGTEKQLSSRRWFRVGQIAWMPDESGLVIAGTSQSWITYQLWYLSYPAGHAQQISNDLNDTPVSVSQGTAKDWSRYNSTG